MQIYLCAISGDLFSAWRDIASGYDFVTSTMQDIFTLGPEAIMAPANSFGFMSGGIDLYFRNYFGQGMQGALQDRIRTEFDGELLVGQATSVSVNHPNCNTKYLIAAPTMRTPEDVSFTINAYLAVRAGLREVMKLNVSSAAIPGMGTGTGGMGPRECAKQVKAAIDDVIVNPRQFPKTIYEEQNFSRTYIYPKKWFEVQHFANLEE